MIAHRRARLLRWLAAGAVCLGFVAAGLLVADRVMLQRELVGATSRTGTWAVVQAEHEYLRLREAFERFARRGDDGSRDALSLRLDVFWSRIPIVLESDEAAGVRSIAGLTVAYRAVADALPALEAAFATLDPRDAAAVDAVERRLDAMADPLRRYVRHVLMQDDFVYNRERLHGVLIDVAASLGALAMAVLALLLVCLRQLRRIGVLLDQARAAENAAAETTERLTQALHAISEGFILLDRDGRIVLVNDRFRSFYPTIADRLVAGADYQALLVAGAVDWTPAAGQSREAAVAARLERFRQPSGPWEQHLADGRTLVVDERRTADGGTVSIRTDISERVRAERDRLDLQQQLNHAQRLEAIGRLAGGIAHDFNNILASMLGYARFIVEDLPADNEAAGFAGQILVAGKRGKDLVQQILVYSRAGEEALEPTDVAAVVDETARMLRSTLPATLRLSVRHDAPRLTVLGSSTKLTQVLMNLAVNAADAVGAARTGRDGEITIAIDEITVDGGCASGLGEVRARIANTAPVRIVPQPDGSTRMWLGRLPGAGRYVHVTVRDNGSGIEAGVLERIFEPFFTTKGRHQGTGLGLAAVLGIVTSHRGAITVDTRPGDGTTFTIYLPQLDSAVSPSAPSLRAPQIHGTARILVVDDQDEVATATALGLRRAGFDVETASDGVIALDRLLRPDGGTFALVLTDQIMPHMSGVELLLTLRRNGLSVPVIVCTGFAEAIDRDEAVRAGAAALLYKPIDPVDLAAAVALVLKQEGMGAGEPPPDDEAARPATAVAAVSA